MNKGAFVVPEMYGGSFDELPSLFVDVCRDKLAGFVWRELSRRPKRAVAVDVIDETDSFWRRVVEEAPNVGPEPIIIVPFSRFGDEIATAALPKIDGVVNRLNVTYVKDMPSGGGTGYMGTVEGVHVYSTNGLTDKAILLSRLSLRVLRYGVVHGKSDIVDFAFVENDNPEKSRVRLKFAQEINWTDEIVVEFDLNNKKPEASALPVATVPNERHVTGDIVAGVNEFLAQVFNRVRFFPNVLKP